MTKKVTGYAKKPPVRRNVRNSFLWWLVFCALGLAYGIAHWNNLGFLFPPAIIVGGLFWAILIRNDRRR